MHKSNHEQPEKSERPSTPMASVVHRLSQYRNVGGNKQNPVREGKFEHSQPVELTVKGSQGCAEVAREDWASAQRRHALKFTARNTSSSGNTLS